MGGALPFLGLIFFVSEWGEGDFVGGYGLNSISQAAFAGRFSGNNRLGMRVIEIKTGTNRMSVPAFQACFPVVYSKIISPLALEKVNVPKSFKPFLLTIMLYFMPLRTITSYLSAKYLPM